MLKDEVIIKILDQAYQIVGPENIERLRNILYTELYHYDLVEQETSLVPVNNKAFDALKMFLATRKLEGCQPGTIENYKMRLTHLLRSFNKNLEDFTITDLRVYFAAYLNSGVKESTLGTAISQVKNFFSWLVDNDYLEKNPSKQLKTPKTEKRVRKALTQEELELVRCSCKTLRDKAMVEMFYATGCRLDELQKLKITDLDFFNGSTLVFGKGKKERRVYLSPKAIVHTKRYLSSRKDTCDALFVTERKPYRRLGRRAIQKFFNKVGVMADLNKSVFPHLMRHTAATTMLNNGASITEVQEMLGHTTPTTTMGYVVLNTQSLQISHRKHLA